MFMRLPARMKNGTASNGKLSTPAIMRCASVTSGVIPLTRMSSSDDVAIASATGRPSSIKMRKAPSSSSIGSILRSVECAGAIQDRIAAPPVFDGDLDRSCKHHDKAEQHDVVDEALWKFDRRHSLVGHDLNEEPDQPAGVAKERDTDEIDHRRKRPRRQMRQIAEQQIDLNMPRQPHAHGRADKHDAHQAIGRDLLGPGVAVIEDIAGEELQEDAQRHDPEDRKRDPIFERVGAKIDLGYGLFLEGAGDLVIGDLGADFSGGHVGLFKTWNSSGLSRSEAGRDRSKLRYLIAWIRSQSDFR